MIIAFHWRQFRIVRARDGKWAIWYGTDECLSQPCYRTAQRALDDLAGGHTDFPSIGDPSELGMPDELGDWSPES